MKNLKLFVAVCLLSRIEAIFLKHIFQDWYKTDDCEGSCQLSMTCWINGGQVNGTCGGYVYSCCKYNKSQRQGQLQQTYAQPRKLEFWDDFEVNNIETLQDVHYGPVRNDPVCGLQRISRRRIVGRIPRLVGKSQCLETTSKYQNSWKSRWKEFYTSKFHGFFSFFDRVTFQHFF